MSNGHKSPAGEVQLLEHDLRAPAKDVHMVSDLTETSLVSAAKLAEAGYISVFDNDEVDIYNSHNTEMKVSRSAILKGWKYPQSGPWRIPLKKDWSNKKTHTVLVNKPPVEFLPSSPPPTEAIFNIYELKKQPELVQCYHAVAGFPTKATWTKAIKNGHYASWPGLTSEIVQKHFPESEEM